MPTRNPLLDTPNPLFHTPNPLFPKDSSKSTSAPKSSQRKPCPKAVKDAVWLKYFGYEMIGKCYVCGKPISYMDFEVGHNKPFTKGGEWNINNLRPICRTCNRSMGTMTIEAFKRKYFGSARAVSK